MSPFIDEQTRQNYARADFRASHPRLYKLLVWLKWMGPVLEIDYSRRIDVPPKLVVYNTENADTHRL